MNAKTDTKKPDAPAAGAPADDKTNLPANQPTGTALAVVEIDEEDRGAGLKNISNDERRIPFLRILQSNSPELEEGNAKFMPNAKAGMFMNTSTKALYTKLVMIPCARDHKFIEYIPRAIGGGFVGLHKPEDDLIAMLRAKQGRFGRLSRNVTRRDNQNQALDGTEIVESFEIYAILIDPETNAKFRAIIPFQSTQIGKYQTLIDRADAIEYAVAGEDVPIKPPFWSHKWLLTTGAEKNKKGSFKGYVIGLFAKKADGSDDVSIKSFIKKSDPLYAMGKEFSAFVEAGQAEVDYSNGDVDADKKPDTDIEM